MNKRFNILVINPGSTSSKIALYENDSEVAQETICYSNDELKQYNSIIDQYALREKGIEEFLEKNNVPPESLHAVVGRGGLLKPIQGGTYRVNESMLEDLKKAKRGEHASNLGAVLAFHIAESLDIPSFIVDPVVVDEMENSARFSGIPEIERLSIFHALNQRAVALQACSDLKIDYHKSTFVVVHMGGGISIGIHHRGRVVDVNNALNGEGPFSPERAGGLPAGQLVEMCFSGKFTYEQIKRKLVGCGGVVAYLSTNDLREVKKRMISGDSEAKEVYEAMVYQIKKHIASMAAVTDGEVDAIVLTGGMAHDDMLNEKLKKAVSWIAPVHIYPGEREMLALAQGTLRVLTGEENARSYIGENNTKT